MKYEVGKTYTIPIDDKNPIKICVNGFHYCKKIDDTFTYYAYRPKNTVIFEVRDVGTDGKEVDDKCVTRAIEILRIVPLSEYNTLFERYKFDERGNMIRWGSACGEWEEYEYDAKNRKIRSIDESGFWATWKYNDDDHTVERNYKNGVPFTYTQK